LRRRWTGRGRPPCRCPTEDTSLSACSSRPANTGSAFDSKGSLGLTELAASPGSAWPRSSRLRSYLLQGCAGELFNRPAPEQPADETADRARRLGRGGAINVAIIGCGLIGRK